MCHTGEIMPGFPGFAELEKSRKPLEGKHRPWGFDFQVPFGCLRGIVQILVTPILLPLQ